MQLTLQSHTVGEVVIMRCRGRIVSGEEVRFFQNEIERLTDLSKNVVLQLADVSYVDSGGLGTLVRMLGVLRAARGDLKICEPAPLVVQVLNATNLLTVFHPYASEKDAIEAFSERPQTPHETFRATNNRIVCLDTSLELLAYLKVLLRGSGYEVFTTQHPSDAATLAMGAPESIVICGPGIRINASALEKFRQNVPNAKLLHLPPDFSISEADQAGPDLVNQVRSLLVHPQ
jgi:anti-anti-sigma factor